MVNPPAISVGVEAPNPFEMTATTLHEHLAKHGGGGESCHMKMFDLRPAEEFAEFHIPSSVNLSYTPDIPIASLAKQLHETLSAGQAAEPCAFLFVSLQSPDLDDLIAREVIGEYEKTHGAPPPANAVGVLVGGVAGYREQYPGHV